MTNNEIYKYRWVLLTCSSFALVLSWGITFSIGIYYVRWIEYFEAGKAEVAIIGSINTAAACLLGPVFGMVSRRLGVRLTGTIGGLLMVIGFVGSAFSPSIAYLCLFYGFIVGTGTGLCYYCASLAVNQYFTRQRSLAEGIASMGAGLGGFAFSVFGQYLINKYNWRGAVAISGAIAAHVIVVFQLMISPTYLRRFPKLSNWRSKEHSQEGIPYLECHSKDEVNHLSRIRTPKIDACKSDLHDVEAKTNTKRIRQMNWFRQCVLLFKNPVFLLIFLAELFCWTAIYMPFMHLPERARILGVDANTVAWLAAAMNIASTIGRPTIMSLPGIFNINVFYLYGVANSISGVVTILSPLWETTTGLFAYASVFGLMNVSAPLVKASAAKLLGSDIYPLAYSWIFFINGVGLSIGPVLAGWIYDVTLSYHYTFYINGAFLLTSGLLTLLQNPAVRLQKKNDRAFRMSSAGKALTRG